ncbi:MAG: TolC family outer membrane protein [Gammaproteobacteria bacterium]|nr:TolC family outer membrane protein [Gammaproteobacteria bacterium]
MRIILFFAFSISSVTVAHAETLNDAYQTMLQSNPELIESKASQDAAWQAYMQLRGGYLPVVALAYNVGRGKGESFSPQTLNIGYTNDNIQHKIISVSQLLWDGGALMNRVESAKSQHDSVYFLKLLQINKLALQTASAYLAVLRSSEMEQVTHQNVNMHLIKLDEIRRRYRGGAGTVGEVALAKTKLGQAEIAWQQNKLNLANARSAYFEVVGQYPSKKLIIPEEPSFSLPHSLQEAECIASKYNPSIMAEQKATQAAWHTAVASRAIVYAPNVSFTLSASRDENLNGITGRTTSMQGYVAITYNIYNGGADLADMRKTSAQFIANKAHLETKRRSVITAINQTWNELQATREKLILLRRGIAASRELASSYRKEWQLGKRSLLDLMDKQNEIAALRLALIDSKYMIKINKFTLLANAGVLPHYFTSKAHAYSCPV